MRAIILQVLITSISISQVGKYFIFTTTMNFQMIEPRHLVAIGVYLEKNKNVNRYKNRLHRFREGKLGLWSQISLLLEMGYTVILKLGFIEIVEPTSDASSL